LAALGEAATTTGAVVRLDAVTASSSSHHAAGYIVSIRRDDRERFEETMSAVHARWIGETSERPGLGLIQSAATTPPGSR